jgi:hypothetical protein
MSPLASTLVDIGFSQGAAMRLVRRYPARILVEWADITMAARERFGANFFRRSPMAYLVDSVKKAAKGERTAPDWWQELRRQESAGADLGTESQAVFARIRAELFGDSDGCTTAADTTGDPTSVGEILGKRP